MRVVTGPSPIHGTGVFAAETVAAGELVGVYEGRITTDLDDPFALALEDDDGRTYGISGDGPLSFMNHSDDPNAVLASGGPYVYARVPIKTGDEITINYGDGWESEE